MEIATVKVKIEKKDLFHHLDFPFVVDGDYSRLVIKYDYSPKQYAGEDAYQLAYNAFVEAYGEYKVDEEDVKRELPLNNHITLSISKDGRLTGTAHRHNPNMEIEIGKRSTVGFHSVENVKGKYILTLSVHAILSKEVLSKIKVRAYE